MRGRPEPHRGMFFAIDLEQRVAPDHPLRPIKRMVDEEAFGWIKKVAGMSRARRVERWKIKQRFTMAAAAYNLARARKLLAPG
ncbi:MAG: hypothetical protein U0572_10035 [Phycisphaerales bacterium]